MFLTTTAGRNVNFSGWTFTASEIRPADFRASGIRKAEPLEHHQLANWWHQPSMGGGERYQKRLPIQPPFV